MVAAREKGEGQVEAASGVDYVPLSSMLSLLLSSLHDAAHLVTGRSEILLTEKALLNNKPASFHQHNLIHLHRHSCLGSCHSTRTDPCLITRTPFHRSQEG
jgi:hypothetical protein